VKAVSVGAKTVNGPVPLRVTSRFTCCKAATSELWTPVSDALVGMSFDWSAWTLSGIAEARRSVNTRYTAVLFIGQRRI